MVVTTNNVIPNKIIGDYGVSYDTKGRVSFFILKECTIGKDKGKLVWSRIIAKLVPESVKASL